MAIPVFITTALKNIKVIGIALLIGGAISAGAGLYYHGKKVESLESKIEFLEAQTQVEQAVKEIVDDAAEENIEQRREISQAESDAIQAIQEAKKEDEEVNNYLNTPIPDRVLTIRKRARCVSLPYTCESSSGE